MFFDPDFVLTKAKLAGIGLVGAILSVLSDPPATNYQRLAAIISGIAIAVIATPPTVEYWHLSPSSEAAAAAVYGIGGKGIVGWIIRAAKDPPAAARELIGLRPKGGEK